MVAAATELAPSDDDARLDPAGRARPARERRIAVAVGALAIVGATTSVAMAAQSALPGDALYPIKRAIENAQTGFSTDEADKGSHLLANASGRLDEVTKLSKQGDLEDSVAIASTLNTFTEQADRGLRPAAGRLRQHRRAAVDRRAAHVHREQHGPADRARGPGPGRGPRRADPRRPGTRPDRRGRRAGLPDLCRRDRGTCRRCSSPASTTDDTGATGRDGLAGRRGQPSGDAKGDGQPGAARDRRRTASRQRAEPVHAGRRLDRQRRVDDAAAAAEPAHRPHRGPPRRRRPADRRHVRTRTPGSTPSLPVLPDGSVSDGPGPHRAAARPRRRSADPSSSAYLKTDCRFISSE